MLTQLTERTTPGSLEDFQQRVNAAFRAQFPNRDEAGEYHYRYVAATFDDYVIASHDTPEGERYFRYDMALDGESITFSNPVEMELRYVPAAVVVEAHRQRAERVSQPRHEVRETRAVAEAATLGDGSTITLTVIEAGFNRPRSRYYTEAAIRDGAGIFRGLKMYANHQTRAEEQARPEGDVWQWVASITETAYDETSKSLRATAKLIDPTFKAKVHALAEAGLLNTLGVSIRAIGAGEQATIEAVDTFRVDEFAGAISVDFVTEPGAGGRVELLESGAEASVQALTLPLLRERRPDLVAALVSESGSHSKEAGVEITQEMLDTEKSRADEAERKAREAEEAKAAAESAVESLKAEATKAAAQEAIGAAIAEANLPEAGQKYLREALSGETDVEAAKATITRFKESVAAMGGSPVKGNGSAVGTGVAAPLKESFAAILGDEKAAELAAAGR